MKTYLIDAFKLVKSNCELIKANKSFIMGDSQKFFNIENLKNYDGDSEFSAVKGLCANANLYALEHYCVTDLIDEDSIPEDFESDNVLAYIAYLFIKSRYPKYLHVCLSYTYPIHKDFGSMWENKHRWAYVDFIIKFASEMIIKLELEK